GLGQYSFRMRSMSEHCSNSHQHRQHAHGETYRAKAGVSGRALMLFLQFLCFIRFHIGAMFSFTPLFPSGSGISLADWSYALTRGNCLPLTAAIFEICG